MDRKIPIYGYKETRVDLQPSSQGSTVAIRLPTHGTSIFPSRTALKRSHVIEFPAAEDEEIFRQRHLATASSIYHRAHHGSPRSILWRVLENSRVLSLQAVDISKDTLKHKKHAPAANSTITLRLNFPNPILPSCIAFSDSREHDTLSVFVLTDNYHLYTLTLRPEHFQKSEASDGNVGDWCKTYLSSAFSFKHPHRLVALSADELLISLIDGGLLKLTRKSGGDGMPSYLQSCSFTNES
jgi:nuclear pore complex protein Nup160